MGWWKAFKEQFGESWQELLYTLELTIAGADDLPWLDTLNFFWDSLPDADKLTTAERRRLAHSVKLLVRQAVQDHYDKEVSQKHAILLRQLRRHQAQAEQHIQQLAEKRQAQLQALSETARQQSMVLPPASELDTLAEGLEGLEELKQSTSEQYRQYMLHMQQDRQRRQSSSQVQACAATASIAVETVGNEHVAINLLGNMGEICPATPASSSSRSSCSSPSRGSGSYQEKHVDRVELQQPLLDAFGATDDSDGHTLQCQVWEHHQLTHEVRGYQAPTPSHQQPSVTQQAEEVVIDIKPAHSHSIMHSGSQLLLQRYLDTSQPAVGAVRCGPEQQQQREADGARVLPLAMSDVSSAGVVRTLSDGSSTADHSSVGPRNSISSSIVATPDSTYSSRAAISGTCGSKSLDRREAVCRSSADIYPGQSGSADQHCGAWQSTQLTHW